MSSSNAQNFKSVIIRFMWPKKKSYMIYFIFSDHNDSMGTKQAAILWAKGPFTPDNVWSHFLHLLLRHWRQNLKDSEM